MIAPAPRKPIPVTICAAMRVGSARMTLPPLTRKSRKPYAETRVNSAEPTDTSMCVRNPASRSRNSRSRPTAPPRAAAITTRSSDSSHDREGISPSSIERRLLRLANRRDATLAEIEQRIERRPVEGRALRGRLHLDQPPARGHDHVQVDLGARVLLVVEVEQQLPADDPERDRRRRLPQRPRQPGPSERARRRDPRARDRGAACPAVRLQHVTVDPERPLPERLEVGHR